MLRETVPLLATVKAYAVQPCGKSTPKKRRSFAESQHVIAGSLCQCAFNLINRISHLPVTEAARMAATFTAGCCSKILMMSDM